MRRSTSRTIAALTIGAALGLLPVPLAELVPLHSTPTTISGTAHAQYGTSRRVARRTSRRTSARHSAYYNDVEAVPVAAGAAVVTTLPAGCAPVNRGGATYQECGDTRYQPAYEGDQLVYVQQ